MDLFSIMIKQLEYEATLNLNLKGFDLNFSDKNVKKSRKNEALEKNDTFEKVSTEFSKFVISIDLKKN